MHLDDTPLVRLHFVLKTTPGQICDAPTEQVEHSSGLFSALTNLAGAGAPALIGWLLSTTGSYTPGFLFMVATIVVSIICCGILIPQKY